MPGKLFIGNLSFKISDLELSDIFAELNIAVASVKVMRDMDTGRSRGFAFAELAPEADMAAAIQQLNGKMVEGRPLTVNEARPQAKREFRGGGGSGEKRGRGDRRGPRDRGGRKRDRDLY